MGSIRHSALCLLHSHTKSGGSKGAYEACRNAPGFAKSRTSAVFESPRLPWNALNHLTPSVYRQFLGRHVQIFPTFECCVHVRVYVAHLEWATCFLGPSLHPWRRCWQRKLTSVERRPWRCVSTAAWWTPPCKTMTWAPARRRSRHCSSPPCWCWRPRSWTGVVS